jgi:hypothetical protein
VSRSIDLFIDSDRPAQELAAEIERLTGLALRPGPGTDSWCLDQGDVHAELRVHPYLDDGHLRLEQYRFALSSRVSNDVRLVDAAETALLRMVSEALQGGGTTTLLVHDLQYREARRPTDSAPVSGPGHAG